MAKLDQVGLQEKRENLVFLVFQDTQVHLDPRATKVLQDWLGDLEIKANEEILVYKGNEENKGRGSVKSYIIPIQNIF